jgi:hypothetical protein
MLPYTSEVFFSLFEQYYRAIWPSQWIASGLAFAVIWLTLKRSASSGRIVSMILALFWLWCAVVYHLLFFTSINFWAFGFAALFLIQAVLFLLAGAMGGRLSVDATMTNAMKAGLALMIYSLAGNPVVSWIAGHMYPQMPLVGVAPCPTVIFTLGFLLTIHPRASFGLWAVPAIWAIIGGSSAWILGIIEDLSLIAALVLFITFRPRD